MPDTAPILVSRNVTKDFVQGNVHTLALRGADLEVYPGEMTLLVGPSGCGKTTMLSVIVGILDPTDGQVVVLGNELTAMSPRRKTAFRRDRIGFVFQQFNLLPSLSAVENAAVPLLIAGRPRREALARAREELSLVGLGHRADAMPRTLSGGEQQRVAIARALVHQPELIVCDEPTSALDAKTGHAIMELLRAVAVQAGRAVVVVTHDPRVFEFADRMATMEDGRITKVEVISQKQQPTGHE